MSMLSLSAWRLLCWLFCGAIQVSVAQDKTIEGIPVYNYNSKNGAGDGKTVWILVNRQSSSEYQVHSVCADAGEMCMSEGKPVALGGLGFSTFEGTEKALAKLVKEHKDDIEFIEPSMEVKAIDSYNYTDLDLMEGSTDVWGLDRIDDQKGLDNDYSPPGDGKGVHVYVLDTGVRTTHTDFGGRAIPAIDATGKGGKIKECSPSDTSCALDRQSHGTHCAATIGGSKYGVAKGVTLHAAKVLGDSGSGSWAGIMGAMDWVSTKGKKPAVMSMSLGGSGRSQAAVAAVDRAAKAGVTVVVAAGNENSDACQFTPAFVPKAITVGATDKNDARARFSNYGKCLDIWGPGVKIMSASAKGDSATTEMSGTSMACPHVAGGAALVLQKNPSMPVDGIVSALKKAAVKGAVTDPKSGSPNELLNVVKLGGGGPGPSPPSNPPGRRRSPRRRGKTPSPGRRRSPRRRSSQPPAPCPKPPPCNCPSPNPPSPSPGSPSPGSPSPGGEQRRRNRGGKGEGSTNNNNNDDDDESTRRRRRRKSSD